jgi:hypothetical protein
METASDDFVPAGRLRRKKKWGAFPVQEKGTRASAEKLEIVASQQLKAVSFPRRLPEHYQYSGITHASVKAFELSALNLGSHAPHLIPRV